MKLQILICLISSTGCIGGEPPASPQTQPIDRSISQAVPVLPFDSARIAYFNVVDQYKLSVFLGGSAMKICLDNLIEPVTCSEYQDSSLYVLADYVKRFAVEKEDPISGIYRDSSLVTATDENFVYITVWQSTDREDSLRLRLRSDRQYSQPFMSFVQFLEDLSPRIARASSARALSLAP